VQRVLFGFNQGAPVAPLQLPKAATAAASSAARPFDLKAFAFAAAREELRPPRVVRIGLIQNAAVAPTTAPFEEQRQVRMGCGSSRRPRQLPARQRAAPCAAAGRGCAAGAQAGPAISQAAAPTRPTAFAPARRSGSAWRR
jgi:hypothetical protein